MNYCDKIKYRKYLSDKDNFAERVKNVLSQIGDKEAVLRLVFFAACFENEEYIYLQNLIIKEVKNKYKDHCPVVSFVAQQPLNGTIALEVQSFIPDNNDILTYKQWNGLPYVLLKTDEGCFLYAGGIQSDIANKNIEEQGKEVFKQLGELLNKEKFSIDSITRQWNYIEQITGFDSEDHNYQTFNNARNDFYQLTSWKNGYPAATGIGVDSGGILIDIEAIIPSSPKNKIIPVDNYLQVAAHIYSNKVLHEAQSRKATPKFERAKKILLDNRELIFVSGTAAIRGESSLEGVGLEKQFYTTMENIEVLVGDVDLVLLRVYLKDKSFIDEVRLLMATYEKNIPVIYTVADVCRDELLIEIEGVAIK